MGLMNNIREFFSGSKNTPTSQPQIDEEYEKSKLANSILNSIDRIKRINSFDSSIWNLSNTSSYDLRQKSLNELKELNSNLANRLSELERQNQRRDSNRESLEASKWTGQKPKNMSDHDFDRWQR